MKLLSLIAIAFFTLTSSAATVGPDSSWQEIVEAGLKPQIPQIWFGSIGVPMTNVCRTEDEIATIDPVSVCTRFEHGRASTDCNQYQQLHLSQSKFYESRECARYATQHECVAWKLIQNEYPSHYKIPIYGKSRFDNGRGDHLASFQFYKVLTVPACN